MADIKTAMAGLHLKGSPYCDERDDGDIESMADLQFKRSQYWYKDDDGDMNYPYEPIITEVIHNRLRILPAIIKKYPQCLDKPSPVHRHTPLTLACLRNRTEAVKILLQANANPLLPDVGYGCHSPIRMACQDGYVDIINHLLDPKLVDNYEMDYMLNTPDDFGETPLHYVVNYIYLPAARLELVKRLLQSGAYPHPNLDNKFPSDICDDEEVKGLLTSVPFNPSAFCPNAYGNNEEALESGREYVMSLLKEEKAAELAKEDASISTLKKIEEKIEELNKWLQLAKNMDGEGMDGIVEQAAQLERDVIPPENDDKSKRTIAQVISEPETDDPHSAKKHGKGKKFGFGRISKQIKKKLSSTRQSI